MNEEFLKRRDRIFESVNNLDKRQKNLYLAGIILLIIAIGAGIYYYTKNPTTTEVATAQSGTSEKVVVRKVGDTDVDAISKEGLSSFFGEITSKDIASINTSRDGVLTSWNVSVGQYVNAGQVLGYVTVTGVSAEQQMRLAEQQANALKAQLDLETANKIVNQTETVFDKIANSLKSVADKQRAIYDGSTGTANTSYQTELNAITSRQLSLQNKMQDFGKTALLSVYPLIAQNGIPPTNTANFGQKDLKNGIGAVDSNGLNNYIVFLANYINLVNNRNLTENDVRAFLEKTNNIIGVSVSSDADLIGITAEIKNLQTDFRDLSNLLTQATIDRASKERERSLIDVELTKNLSSYENDLSLKKLEQLGTNERAKNEARGAQLLAEKLSVSAGGVIPILASKSGIVATVDKNVGDYITISERIGYISNNNPVKIVRFTIPPSWRDIKKGDTLSISWRPDFSMGLATLSGISPIIDEKGGHQAEALLSRDTVFPVGSSVRLIPENSKKGVFVNRKAIFFIGTTPYVWLVMENNAIRKQEITPGRELGEYVEILSGLEKDFSYLVILDSTLTLRDGEGLADIIKTDVKVGTEVPKKVQDESQPHSHDE